MADFPSLAIVAEGPRSDNTTFSNLTLDASNDGLGFIMDIHEAATIATVLIRQGTVTGTAPAYIVAIESKGADGNPDGTILGGASPASASFTPTAGNDGTILAITLSNTLAVTRGQSPALAITIRYDSVTADTIDGSNNCSFTRTVASAFGAVGGMPFSNTLSAGTWTRQDDRPVCGLRSSTTSYGFALESVTDNSADAADTPDEFGSEFTFPDGTTDAYSVGGAKAFLDTNAPGDTDTLSVILYNDTTVLQQRDEDGDFSSNAAEGYEFAFSDTTLDVLAPGTAYILAMRTDSATVPIKIRSFSFATAGDAKAATIMGGWLTPGYVERTDAGSWSAPDYKRILALHPMLGGMTEAAGAASGARNPLRGPVG